MPTNNVSHATVIKHLLRTTASRAANAIVFVVNDVFLAWPRALFIALPLSARNVRTLFAAKTLFTPQVRDVATLAQGFFSRTQASVEVINKLSRALAKVADHMGGLTAETTCGHLEEQRLKLQRLKAFVVDVMTPQEGEEGAAADEPEIVQEIAKSTVLLNRLIKDLSSRTGFFSTGKKADEPVEQTLARATAISVKEPARSPDDLVAVDPYSAPGPVATAVTIPVRMAPALEAVATGTPALSARVAVVLRPAPSSVSLNTRADAQFLQNARNLGQSQPNTFLSYLGAIVHFIAVDILIGIPKFILYDLPQAIISFQSWSSYYVSKIESSSQSLIEIKNLLIAINGIFLQLDRLTPVINGIELYLSRHIDADATAAKEAFRELMAQIDVALETLDPAQIRTIKSEMKKLILRVNPMLIGAIEALEGKSFWGAMTSSRRHTTPVGGSASDSASMQSGASSGESSTNTVAGFFKAALKAIAVPPPGGGSPPVIRASDAASLGGSSLSSGSGELKDPAAASVAGSSVTGTPVAGTTAKKPNTVLAGLQSMFSKRTVHKNPGAVESSASSTPKAPLEKAEDDT